MGSGSITSEELRVLDEGFFNKQRFIEWHNMLLDFAGESIKILQEQIGNIEGVSYNINPVLLREVVYDAMIGLKTIVASENNTVESPNPFKIAAYLGYWFLRHKPILFIVANNTDVDSLTFESDESGALRKDIIIDMKHINELTVAHFVLRYIFEIENDNPICGQRCLRKVKKTGTFCFDDFDEMLNAIYEKLKYHLTYRAVSPKTLEHFLEAYTLHPYLPYTSDLWNTNDESDD